jgi:putative transposase
MFGLRVATNVAGAVRNVADGVSLSKQTNQKISRWNHGQLRKLVEYKAEAEGIALVLQDERYSNQTCPICRARHYEVSLWDKPRGRVYRCPACGTQSHRDVVGQVNPFHLSARRAGPYPAAAAPQVSYAA